MKNKLVFFVAILLTIPATLFSQSNNEIPITQIISYDSDLYGESRKLYLSLPMDYKDTKKEYPVLYVLFPESNYFRAKSAAWHVEGRNGIPEFIVVGISNKDSWNEVFPFKLTRRPTSGGADRFLESISTEVIPFIESNYRADSLRILAGFSNSAMFACHAMVKKSELFKSYILSSPMLGWGDNYVLKETIDFFSELKSFDKTLYVIYGGNDYQNVLNPMPQFEKLLKENSPENLKWKVDLLENEHHVPYIDVYNGLVFTFEKLNEQKTTSVNDK
ncbi:alpha/beta hydrolase-fold protein [Maribellus sp. YY47]|uniref:alpha/beta hydrolase n=1 Tax=Maribellus sp. YY47 TaxID=2929486 RepID=UPI002001BF43|nr:alpha/beta hydrolase-fold protein [Maribellus sp. YY47]MCK3682537.1 alpha/beta hydrolase-fold protein [Maribellus sp. YY47]